MWKEAIKLSVAANPKPNPHITLISSGDRTKVSGHPNRPYARVTSQALQPQRWMRRIAYELSITRLRGNPNFRWKLSIGSPEFRRSFGCHTFRSKSASVISGNASGFDFILASILSIKALKFGRDRGSLMMRRHSESSLSSGRSSGRSSANCARSFGESARIASSISFTVLT